MPAYSANFPLHDSGYPLYNQHGEFIPVDSIIVWESILNQIDWFKVIQDSGVRESPDIYRYFFETIVHPYVEQLLKREEYNTDMMVEYIDQDDGYSSAESESTSNEDGFENDSQQFEDNMSLHSDDSGYGSDDYVNDATDDETEDGEDSEDEDQMEDDCEEIHDWRGSDV